MNMKRMAASMTLHCLVGCAIGEMIGVTIGTSMGWPAQYTVLLAAGLSFVSGYGVSTWPMLRGGMSFVSALRAVMAADTISILTMTIVDNLVMLILPGAMDKNLMHPIYWLSRTMSLSAAFVTAYPVNLWQMRRGKSCASMDMHHM